MKLIYLFTIIWWFSSCSHYSPVQYKVDRSLSSLETCRSLVSTVNGLEQTPLQKARWINNQEGAFKGSFAEIGAGQEIVGTFYRAKRASETVVKSISAYGKEESNRLYGEGQRFVSEVRLNSMLDVEFSSIQSLKNQFDNETTIFSIANTVTTNKNGNGHGWIGIRYLKPGQIEPQEIKIHFNFGKTSVLNQHIELGKLGVNLIHAMTKLDQGIPDHFLPRLMDNISVTKLSIDHLYFSNLPDFSVKKAESFFRFGLIDNLLYNKKGTLIPKDLFYKKYIYISSDGIDPRASTELDIIKIKKAKIGKRYIPEDDVFLWKSQSGNLFEKLKFFDQGLNSEVLYQLSKEELESINESQVSKFIQKVKGLNNNFLFEYNGNPSDLDSNGKKLFEKLRVTELML